MKKKLMKMGGVIALILLLTMTMGFVVMADETTDAGSDNEIETGTSVNLADGSYEVRWMDDTADYTYSGEEIKPQAAVYDVTDPLNPQQLEEQAYTVKYEDNVKAGTAKVIVTGVEEQGYTGTLEKEFSINKKSIETLDFSIYKTYFYTGKSRKPSVTLKDGNKKLVRDRDYTVSYYDCVKIGTATVTVKGKGNYTGTISKTYQIKLGKIAVNKISSVTYNKIKMSWNKVTGASGYRIYRSTSKDGKYSLVKTITSGSTLSYTDTGLTNGRTYYYKVRAYKMVDGVRKYSSYSPVVSKRAQVAQADIASVKSRSYTSITIKWDRVPYANGYKIYRSTSLNGTYKTIGYTRNDLFFVDTGRTTGKTYYYKVRAYRYTGNTRYYGLSSEKASGRAIPNRAKISSNSSSTTSKAKLYWGRVSGASGYEVYRSETKNGTYKRVKTITSGSTLNWTNTNLTNKTYYYKVRAYRVVNGEKVYGIFSEPYKRYKAGWRYVKGYKLYYNSNNELVKDVRGIIGKQSRYHLEVNRKTCTVNVFAKDGDNGYIIPVKTFICSVGLPGTRTPKGTFHTLKKYRWRELMGPSYGQYATRIVSHTLFHSVPCRSMSIYSLYPNEYNRLGSPASHGCVRMTVEGAKWIYDYCKIGTSVKVYDSSYPGPFGKPKAKRIPWNQTWDPTDPAI